MFQNENAKSKKKTVNHTKNAFTFDTLAYRCM